MTQGIGERSVGEETSSRILGAFLACEKKKPIFAIEYTWKLGSPRGMLTVYMAEVLTNPST